MQQMIIYAAAEVYCNPGEVLVMVQNAASVQTYLGINNGTVMMTTETHANSICAYPAQQ